MNLDISISSVARTDPSEGHSGGQTILRGRIMAGTYVQVIDPETQEPTQEFRNAYLKETFMKTFEGGITDIGIEKELAYEAERAAKTFLCTPISYWTELASASV